MCVGGWVCCCVWVWGCVGVWVCGCVGVWVCGCVGVWVCGCVGVWVCECVGLWVCICILHFFLDFSPRARTKEMVCVMNNKLLFHCFQNKNNSSDAFRVALLKLIPKTADVFFAVPSWFEYVPIVIPETTRRC